MTHVPRALLAAALLSLAIAPQTPADTPAGFRVELALNTAMPAATDLLDPPGAATDLVVFASGTSKTITHFSATISLVTTASKVKLIRKQANPSVTVSSYLNNGDAVPAGTDKELTWRGSSSFTYNLQVETATSGTITVVEVQPAIARLGDAGSGGLSTVSTDGSSITGSGSLASPITLGVPVTIARGGTNATSAAAARTSLDVQQLDADLTGLAAGGAAGTVAIGGSPASWSTSPSLTKVIVGSGSVAAPSFTFTGSTSTGLWSYSVDAMNLSVAGVEGWRFKQTETTAVLPLAWGATAAAPDAGFARAKAETMRVTAGDANALRDLELRELFFDVNDYVSISTGTGSPEGAVTQRIGSIYLRTDGGAGTSVYVKESGTGNTGWVVAAPGGDLTAITETGSVCTITNGTGPAPVLAFHARIEDIATISWAQGDVAYFNGTNLVRLPAGTSGQFFKTLGAGANPAWATVTGDQPFVQCDAIQGVQPISGAFPDYTVRNNHGVLQFDPTADEAIVFENLVMPASYAAGTITVTLYWVAATATSGDVVWNVQFEAMAGTDIDADSYASVQAATGTANGTSGILTATSITLTQAQADAIAAGGSFRIQVIRDADNGSDSMTGDAQLLCIAIKEDAGLVLLICLIFFPLPASAYRRQEVRRAA